jgi:hypothetical protein
MKKKIKTITKMNTTIPSVMPCINIVGNEWMFVLGLFVGFVLAYIISNWYVR